MHRDPDRILCEARLNRSGGLDDHAWHEGLWQLLLLRESLESGITPPSCDDFIFAGARALAAALMDTRQVMEQPVSKDRSSQLIDRFPASFTHVALGAHQLIQRNGDNLRHCLPPVLRRNPQRLLPHSSRTSTLYKPRLDEFSVSNIVLRFCNSFLLVVPPERSGRFRTLLGPAEIPRILLFQAS